MSSDQLTTTPAAPGPDKQKSPWDSVLTATPVVLTVLATLLAGLSSAEMTLAQYHRSLAAQHQSKAGDQWSFFQAKRIRGGNTEMEIELFRTQHTLVPVTTETVIEYAARLPQDLNRTAAASERLLRATGEVSDPLRAEIKNLTQAAQQGSREALALQASISKALAQPEVRDALAFLSTTKLPDAAKEAVGNDKILEAHRAVLARQTEAETASLIARISGKELRQSLDAATNNAHAFEETSKLVDKEVAAVALLIKEATSLTGGVHRLAQRVNLALAELETNENGAVRVAATSATANELRNAAAALERADAALTRSADEMTQSFVAARRDFTARRYEREARDNEEIAGVYEIQVRKSSWQSERHRKRSQLFFIGMLVAQAGVTIATFSLAMRQRNVFWALATVAGLAAILFSGYVYLWT
jgi:hypothetical protein